MYLWLIFQRFGSVLNALKDNFPILNLSVYFHEIDRQVIYIESTWQSGYSNLSVGAFFWSILLTQILDLQDYISGYLYSSLSNWF